MSDSHFVASWKNASCSGWNTAPRWLATHEVTLVLSSPRPTDCPSQRTHPLALGTPLKGSPIPISPISSARSHQGNCSSLRQAWRMTNEGIAILPKQRPHEGLPALGRESSGLGPKRPSRNFVTPIWSFCMPDERAFQPLLTSPLPCGKSGLGERLPLLRKSHAASPNNGRPIW